MSLSIIVENTLPYIYFISSIYLSNCIRTIKTHLKPCENVQIKTVHPLEKEAFFFKSTFDDTTTNWNQNIRDSLYDYKTFSSENKAFQQLETEWTRRILFQHTNYGNVILYYDLYRQAFVYYSDTQIPYTTLNLCAMKYIRLYACRDFFVDTQVLPEDFINPFNQMKEDEIKREKEKQREKRKKQNLQLDHSVFVTKKKYTQKERKNETNETNESPPKPVYKNNFRYLGKTLNYSFLQAMPKKKTQPNPQLSKTSPISDHYDYITYKDSLQSPDKTTEPSPFYQKFEQLLI
jgi:hypothetical protein